ncbi:MAG: glycosyltransferase family 2 protein [Armatimonadota bacterium]|nr:glycosyltransferase family 2 protein [Armatimonadota bacterium]
MSKGNMIEPSVAAIVLNWRTPELTSQCVESLLTSDFDGVLSIIVVDNNSEDGSVDLLKERFGNRIAVIENKENLGYAGGMNVGISRAMEIGAKYVFLLNSDIKLDSCALAELYRAAEEHPDGVFFGPRIFDIGKPDDQWFIGGRWDWLQGTIRIVRGYANKKLPLDPWKIEFVNGAAMFARMSCIQNIGMFDERFGLYFEESDLCSRAAKAGYTLWHVPTASVYHQCGASMSKAIDKTSRDIGQYYRTRNRLLWGKKNLVGLRSVVFWANVAVRFPLKYLSLLLSGQTSKRRGFEEGFRDFVMGRFGMRNFLEE